MWGEGGETYRVRSVGGLYTLALEEETDRCHVLALSLAEGVHKLLELSTTLDLEEHLVVVVCNFNVQMLCTAGIGVRALASRAAVIVLVRHRDGRKCGVCFDSD